MKIREMAVDDLADIEEIEKESFDEEAWSGVGLLTYLIRDDTLFLVAEEGGSVIGYAGLLMVPCEGDLIKVAVRKEKRGQGIATAILETMWKEARDRGVTQVHLEVRGSNEDAIALYRKEGFTQTGIRKDYYLDPREDAVTMTREDPVMVTREDTVTMTTTEG